MKNWAFILGIVGSVLVFGWAVNAAYIGFFELHALADKWAARAAVRQHIGYSGIALLLLSTVGIVLSLSIVAIGNGVMLSRKGLVAGVALIIVGALAVAASLFTWSQNPMPFAFLVVPYDAPFDIIRDVKLATLTSIEFGVGGIVTLVGGVLAVVAGKQKSGDESD